MRRIVEICQLTCPVGFFQQFLSPSHRGYIASARNGHFLPQRVLRSLAGSLPAAHNVSVTHHQPAIALSTDALAANGRPAGLGADHADKSSTLSYAVPQKHSPSANKTTHPLRAVLGGEPPPGGGLRDGKQHSTKMLTVTPRPQYHSPGAGKLLTLAKDFYSPSAYKSPHFRHKTAHLQGTNPLFLHGLQFLCCWFVGFRF